MNPPSFDPNLTTLSFEGLDPTLLEIAILVGIFKQAGDQAIFNTDWFRDPLESIRAIPTQRRRDLLKLLQRLLGGSAGSALGTPQTALNRTWYPIRYPGGASGGDPEKTTGLYVVTNKSQDGEARKGRAGRESDDVVVGLGVLYPVKQGPVTINPYAYFPLFELSENRSGFGFDNNPVELGIEITGSNEEPFGAGEVSFTGFKVASSLFFNATPPRLDFILLNLTLPGQEAADRSLLDLIEKTSVEQWLSSGASVLAGLLAETVTDAEVKKQVAAITTSVLNLLGLTGTLPPVAWERLLREPDQAAAIFLQWFQAIASSATQLAGFLNNVYALRNAIVPVAGDAADHVTGIGTRSDPFAIELIKVAGVIAVNFTVATEFDDQKRLHVYPGLRAASTPFQPVNQVAVQLAAATEVIDIVLDAAPQGVLHTVAPPTPFPSLSLLAVLANPKPGQPLFTIGSQDGEPRLSLGTAALGVAYGTVDPKDDARTLIPTLRLNNVTGTYGSWEAIDLTNYDQTLRLLGEGLAAFVAEKLKQFLGESGGALAANLAAVLGIAPPPNYPGTWPVQEMLLSGGQLQLLIENPLGALGSYYTRCLQAVDTEGQPAWRHLLPSFAGMLGGAGVSIAGAGTAGDPWQVELAQLGGQGPVASLQAWRPALDEPSQPSLSFAVYVSADLRFDQATLTMAAKTDLLTTKLPQGHGTGSLGAEWLAEIQVQLRLSGAGGPLTTQPLAGMHLQADYALLASGWNLAEGFHWLARVAGVAIKYASDPQPKPIGSGRLEFSSHSTTWDERTLAQFAPVTLTVFGMALLGTGGRLGLILTCALGLLPALPEVIHGKPAPEYPFEIPPGLPLPPSWPVLTIADPARFFINPWPDLRNQIAALFASGKPFAIPMLRVLGWGLTGSVPPDSQATGTWDDPWAVSLPIVWNLEVLVWAASGKIGFGLGRPLAQTEALGMTVAALIRTGLVYLNLDGVNASTPILPRATLSCLLTGDPLLVGTPQSDVQVGSARLGAYLDRDGVFPVVTLLKTQLSPDRKFPTIELVPVPGKPIFTSNEGLPVMDVLLGAVMAKLSMVLQEATESAELRALLGLLIDLQLAEIDPSAKTYGINVGAWDTLLANPPAFLSTQMAAVLQDDRKFTSLIDNLATLIGFSLQLPAALTGLPDVLTALGLMQRTAFGYTVRLSRWVSLVSNPVDYFNQRLQELLNDEAARQALISQLSDWIPPAPPLPKLRFSVDSGVRFAIAISPENPLDAGAGFRISGGVTLDLQTSTFAAGVLLSSPVVGSGLAFEYAIGSRGTGAWQLKMEEDRGLLPPAFEPLQIYPLPADRLPEYFKQLGLRLPLSILSTLAGSALSRYVLPRYKLAENAFEALGLLERSAPDKPYQVKWLLRAFLNPVAWILSPAVLGDGAGGIDLDKLGGVLYTLPGPDGIDGPGGILLQRFETTGPKAKGMELVKLPYGVDLKMSSGSQTGVAVAVGAKPKLEISGLSEISIAAGMAFGAGNGVAVFGGAKLCYAFGAAEDQRELCIASSFASDRFGLQVTGKSGSYQLPQITLLPFQGLSQYVPSGGDIVKLLDFVASESLKAYEKYKQGPGPDPNLVKFVDAVLEFASYFGVADPSSLMAVFKAIQSGPVKWLTGWFDPGRTPQTLTALNTLLSKTFGLKGFSIVDEGILQFAPDIGSDVGSLKIKLGNRTRDSKTVFGAWIEPALKKLFLEIGLEAGVGVETPIDVSAPTFRFMTNASLAADVESFTKEYAGVAIPMKPELHLNADVSTSPSVDFGVVYYPVKTSSGNDTLAIMLLPDAALAYGKPPKPIERQDAAKWLLDLAVQFLVPLVSDMALRTSQVAAWMNNPIAASQVTPGGVLADWGLLTATGKAPDIQYVLADLKTAFAGLTPKQVVEKLIYTALSGFPGEFPILKSKNVDLFIASKTSDPIKDFGLGVRVTDLIVAGAGGSPNGKPPRISPQLLLQVGKWTTGDTNADSWFSRAGGGKDVKPGLILYLVAFNQSTQAPSFNANLEMISIGVDFKGVNQKPLADVKGFKLGGVEPRIYFGIDMKSPADFQLGAGIRVDDMGIPLGPGFAGQTGGSNPVAQSLLTSRNDDQSQAPGKDTQEAINPGFSATAGYVKEFNLQFYQNDGTGEKTDKVWIPVQRAFGPLQCRKIGAGWQGKPDFIFSALFDGKVSLAALAIDMVGLSVGIPVTDIKNFNSYKLELAGLNVTFAGGPVLLSGGLIKTEPPLAYTGQVIIKAANFMIGGLGSYAQLVGNPSLFAFAFIALPIGGPPYFFIKGFAGGFGFNRGLRLPGPDAVHEFPLVAGLAKPEVFGNGSPKAGLEALARDIYPDLGNYWLAAGLKFATFELLETTAILFIQFGKDFQLSLLGLSIFRLPKNLGIKTYVQAELAIVVALKFSEGSIVAAALLTPNSYLIDEKCRLTGGFSFNLWFGGRYKGDFVLTIGGYHPVFDKPEHFPTVPRVGFRWPVSSQVTIQGGAYFALTPSCVMAGGALALTYQSGKLNAWFTAYANFLIAWKPFYYDISIGVSIGASYEIAFIVTKTVSVELSASVEVWGPRMRGKARVKWWVISFTVTFGDGDERRPSGKVVDWQQFSEYFLPPPDKSADARRALWTWAETSAAMAADPPTPQNIVALSAAEGMIRIGTDDPDSAQVKKGAPWIVRAAAFKLVTKTAIPATQIVLVNSGSQHVFKRGGPVGARPLGSVSLESTHTIAVRYLSGSGSSYLDLSRDWDWTADESGVPSALWDTRNDGYETPSAQLLERRLVGIAGGSPKQKDICGPPQIDLKTLAYLSLPPRPLPWPRGSNGASDAAMAAEDSFKAIEDTVMSPAVIELRQQIVDAAIDFGINAADGRLDLLAAAVSSILDAEPMLGPLGGLGPGAQAVAGAPVRLQPAAERASAAQPSVSGLPRLVAVIRQYSHPDARAVGEPTGFSVRPASSVTGKVHTIGSLTHSQDVACLAAVAPSAFKDAGERIPGMTLHVGATLLWDLPHGSSSGGLHFDGTMPVRVAAFDRNHAWVCCREVAGSGPEDFAVPAGAARLALTGLPPQERNAPSSPVLGWHRYSSLIQVNPHASLGEGVIVWTRAPRRIRYGVRSLDHGLSPACEAVDANRLQNEDGSTQLTWIETAVPSSVRTVTVLLRRADKQPVEPSAAVRALEVSVPLDAPDGEGGRHILQPQEVIAQGAEVNLLYSIPPAETKSAREIVSVLVRTELGWVQQGLVGTEDEPSSAKERWGGIFVEPRAVCSASDLKTAVRFTGAI